MTTSETILLVVILLLGISTLVRLAAIAARLATLEAKLQMLRGHIGMPAESPASDEVVRLAKAGYKIDAIKRHREETGAGLAEAKAFVDRLVGQEPGA